LPVKGTAVGTYPEETVLPSWPVVFYFSHSFDTALYLKKQWSFPCACHETIGRNYGRTPLIRNLGSMVRFTSLLLYSPVKRTHITCWTGGWLGCPYC
jgi:hypothetical protein